MMTDLARIDRLDAQAMALVDELDQFLAGRPVDVIVDALATAAGRIVAREAALSRSDIAEEVAGAKQFVEESMVEVVPRTRRDRLRFSFYALHVAVFSSAVINLPEGRCE